MNEWSQKLQALPCTILSLKFLVLGMQLIDVANRSNPEQQQQ